MEFNDKNLYPSSIVDDNNNEISKDDGLICPSNQIISRVGFKSFESFIMSLKLDYDTLKKLNNTFKDKKVFKITLNSIMLEKLNLERLFFKNNLDLINNNVEFEFNTFERFFNLNNLYHNINYKKSNFLLDSIIVLKREITKDGLINTLFVNRVVLRQIKKLLKTNKLYGIKDHDKKGLYNVFIHKDNNDNHFLLDVEDINFKALYSKDNLNYTTLEKVENYYLNLNDLKTSEKLLLIEKIKDFQKNEYLQYINNLTFKNIESFYNDYEGYNYKASYKGLQQKDIKINTNNLKDYLSYYHEYIRHLKRLYL